MRYRTGEPGLGSCHIYQDVGRLLRRLRPAGSPSCINEPGIALVSRKIIPCVSASTLVLIGTSTFEEGGDQNVAFVLNLTERKRAVEHCARVRRSFEPTPKPPPIGFRRSIQSRATRPRD
jgi:hypothetical protein